MTIKASDVFKRVQVILQDAGATRWPLTELAMWLSDAAREIANSEPKATATRVTLEMVPGTRQTVPAGYSSLIRVMQNVGGHAVTTVPREALDAQNVNWHDPTRRPFKARVDHIIMDPLEPLAFHVYPGNDGTGQIEATLSAIPADIVPSGDASLMASYDIALPFIQSYQGAMVDFVLYRAFTKDLQYAGAAQRAQAHFQQFTTAMALSGAKSATYNVNTTNAQPVG